MNDDYGTLIRDYVYKKAKEEGKLGKLVLVRGIPGSGKSTFAKETYPDYNHLETDMFFVVDGEYKFDKSKQNEYHEQCQALTRDLLLRGENVIVTNTFVRLWELEKYTTMEYSDLTVIRLDENYGSIHSVPDDVVERMKNTMEDYEGEIRCQ